MSLVEGTARFIPPKQQKRLSFGEQGDDGSPVVYCAGDEELLAHPCVAIVGTRKPSPEGAARAARLARELAARGVVIMSGLAAGIDTVALRSALHHGGRVVAVIGTPLDRAYPRENADLQAYIYRHHLLISPFKEGSRTHRSNFPNRNKVMAALSDGTIVVEASDTSGTLHQSAECQRLDRWLFILKSLAQDPSLSWPQSFLGKYERAIEVGSTSDILERVLG